MLNMLTAIDERFRSNPDILNNLDRISFEFLDLNDLELNETLYLKMNSCGRKISQFDKIKSEIDKILPEQVPSDARCRFVLYSDEHLETLDSFDKKWRYCIDRKWSNLFWDRASHTYDTSFLSFLTNYLAASAGETYTYADSLLSVDFSDNTFYLPWKWFEAYIKVNKDYLEKVAAVLNKLVYNLDKAEDIVKEMLALPVSYLDRAKTFGLLSFSGDDFSSTEFVEWERFIRNYATHTVEDKRTFFAFTERITKEFSSKSTDILAYLSKKYKTAKHERTQLNEEYFKAHVILEGEEELELKIRSAEKHPLLEGRLRPLISDGTRYDEHSFPYIYENFCKYFGDDGKNLEFNDDGNNLKFKAELQSRTEFATAFVKGISRMDQLENQLIFDLSENGLKEKLKVQQLEPIFRKCLLSDKLTNIADEERQDQNDECVQIKDTLLKPGVIEGILKYKIGEKLRVHWYHNCRCLFPYNGKTSTDRIGFDHINNDEKQWTRKRNQVLSDLIKESYEVKEQPVSSVPGIALWWGSDIRFIPPAQYQDKNQSICLLWSADFNIGIIKGMDDTTWIKRRGKTAQENENYLFNAVGMDNNEIKEKIENMIKEYKDDQRI